MKTEALSNKKKTWLLITISIIVLSFIGCFSLWGIIMGGAIEILELLVKETNGIILPAHSIDELGMKYEKLWEIANVSATTTSNSGNLTTFHDKVYLITKGPDENIPTILSIVALDVLTGELKWRANGKFGSDLTHNSTYLYTSIDRDGIAAYDPESGRQVWKTHLSGVRGIDHIVVTETELFITTVPDNSFVLDSITGRITEFSSFADIGTSVFLVKDNVIYWQQWPLNLVATNLQSGVQNWTKSFESGFEKTPLFVDGSIFVVTFNGQLHVLNQSTGDVVWNTEVPDSLVHPERIVSNVAVADGVVYYLTQDAQLRAVSMYTGELISVVEFTPSLFDLETDVNNYRYDVAANSSFVTVYFGDSDQIFAFRFLQDK